MTELPCTLEALVVRTDFSVASAWDVLRATVLSPNEDGFLANVAFVDDRTYEGLTLDEAVGLVPTGYRHPLLVLADGVSLASPELPLLVVYLPGGQGRHIRVVATELWGIENNLSIGNMDFEEFARSVHADGVFRGF